MINNCEKEKIKIVIDKMNEEKVVENKFANGKIYKVYNTNEPELIYIGGTYNNFHKGLQNINR